MASIDDISTQELLRFAGQHNVTEAQVRTWATEDGNFPQEFLRTHGIANWNTYLKLVEFYIAKRAAGLTFAEANAATSTALKATVALANKTEAENVALIRGIGTGR